MQGANEIARSRLAPANRVFRRSNTLSTHWLGIDVLPATTRKLIGHDARSYALSFSKLQYLSPFPKAQDV